MATAPKTIRFLRVVERAQIETAEIKTCSKKQHKHDVVGFDQYLWVGTMAFLMDLGPAAGARL